MTRTMHPLLSHYSSTKWGREGDPYLRRGAYLRGEALIRCFLRADNVLKQMISFHSRDVFYTLSCHFVPSGFRLFCARLVVHYLAVHSVSGVKLSKI